MSKTITPDSKKRKLGETAQPHNNEAIVAKAKAKLFDAGYTVVPVKAQSAFFQVGDCIYDHVFLNGYDVVAIGYDQELQMPVYAAVHRLDHAMELRHQNQIRIPLYRIGDVVKIKFSIMPAKEDDGLLWNYKDARITRIWLDGNRYAYDYEFTKLIGGGTC